MPVKESLVPLSEVCLLIGEAPARVFGRLSRGELKGQRRGRRWLIERRSIERFLAKREREKPSPLPAA